MTMIASVGFDLPHDLLHATGRYAGPLAWNIDRPTPKADQWLENKFPLWSRSIVEDWASSAFDHLDRVLFSRADDAAQRLYYYLCELQRRGAVAGPKPLIFDIAKIARPSSLERTIDSVRKLALTLDVEASALEQAIATTNARRRAVSADAATGPVCLLAGTPPPDERLHEMVGAAGWSAHAKTLAQVWADLGPTVEEASGDPFAALGRAIHNRNCGVRGFFDRSAVLVADAQSADAKAVILWFAEEDEGEVWHLPGERAALDAAGIPTLVLTRRDWRAKDGTADEIAAFLKGLEA
jgi:hypothetical protein